MARSVFLAGLVVGQVIVLLAAGAATLWWSSDLMLWLIHLVGEERALGADNVVTVAGGGKLLTNPGGMFRWTLPFWFLGVIQITGALTLCGLWLSRGSTRSASRPNRRGILEKPIGIRTHGEAFTPFVEAGQQLPFTCSRTFTYITDGRAEVEVELSHRDDSGSETIASLLIGIPRATDNALQITVNLKISPHRQLWVNTTVLATASIQQFGPFPVE
jgi:hypothetical protein